MRIRAAILVILVTAALELSGAVGALAQGQGVDPPGRVGRLAQISGTVSFHASDENQWQPATLNYPITSGNSLWTEPRSHAAVDVGSSRLYLDSSTELDVGTLDDQSFLASLPQGAAYLRVYNGSGQYEIDTPRAQVVIGHPGYYEIVAGDAGHPTIVTVFEGLAQVTGPGVSLALGAQQSGSIAGQGSQLSVSTGQAAPPDDFVRFVQDEERAYENQAAAPPQGYGSPGMTGYQDLAQYGAWQSAPDYGPIWYPQVASGWAPYRYGHWAYVAPWGWTWVDDAPWGFAPFHYGRWVEYGGRWGWVPGAYEQYPVYAPALVAFFGDFGGIGVGIAIGQAVGWVPLGPEEVYYPGYRTSPNYLRRMNVAYVHNTTIINYNYYNTPHGNDYARYRNHQHGATMVSGDAMQHSRPIGQAWKQMPQGGSSQQWTHAKPYGGQAPIKPSFATVGVTAGTARQIGLSGIGAPNKTHAPGPQIYLQKGAGPTGNQTLQNRGAPGPTVPPYTGTNRQNLQPGVGVQGNQPQGQGGGQTLKNKGTPGPTVPPYTGSNRQNLQPGVGVQGNQPQGQGGSQTLKNKGTPGPTVPPYTGTNRQNLQPGVGVQGNQPQGQGGSQTLKNKGTPGPTVPPYTGSNRQNLQPGVGVQGNQPQGQGGSQTLKNKGTPGPTVPPYTGSNRQNLQPGVGVQGNQPQGQGGSQTLKNKGTPGPTVPPYTGSNRQNLQPGVGVQGNQPQGQGSGQTFKNQGAPGPTVPPYTGTNRQNLQPGTGSQRSKCPAGATNCTP